MKQKNICIGFDGKIDSLEEISQGDILEFNCFGLKSFVSEVADRKIGTITKNKDNSISEVQYLIDKESSGNYLGSKDIHSYNFKDEKYDMLNKQLYKAGLARRVTLIPFDRKITNESLKNLTKGNILVYDDIGNAKSLVLESNSDDLVVVGRRKFKGMVWIIRYHTQIEKLGEDSYKIDSSLMSPRKVFYGNGKHRHIDYAGYTQYDRILQEAGI